MRFSDQPIIVSLDSDMNYYLRKKKSGGESYALQIVSWAGNPVKVMEPLKGNKDLYVEKILYPPAYHQENQSAAEASKISTVLSSQIKLTDRKRTSVKIETPSSWSIAVISSE